MKTPEKPFLLTAFDYLPQILLGILIGLVGLFIWELSSYATLVNVYVADESERYAKALAKPIFLEVLALVLILSGGYFAFKENRSAKFFATVSAFVITIVNIVFVYQMFRHYESQTENSILMPEIELYLIVIAIFAVGEFLSYYVVSEYRKNANVLIDTSKEVDLNQLWTFIELFGLPHKVPHKSSADIDAINSVAYQQVEKISNNTVKAEENVELIDNQCIDYQENLSEPEKRKNKPRGNSVNYDKIYEYVDKGLSISQTALLCKCSEFTVKKAKKERQEKINQLG